MGRLNHHRAILQLIDAKKRGLLVEDMSESRLGKRYLTPGLPSATRSRKKATGKELVHEVAVAILDHFVLSGDCTDATHLLKFAKQGADRDALKCWFLQFGGMRLNAETGSFAKDKGRQPDRDKGLANPYWTLKATAKRKPFHLEVELSAFVSKARERKRESASDDKIPDGLMKDLEDFLRDHAIGFD